MREATHHSSVGGRRAIRRRRTIIRTINVTMTIKRRDKTTATVITAECTLSLGVLPLSVLTLCVLALCVDINVVLSLAVVNAVVNSTAAAAIKPQQF